MAKYETEFKLKVVESFLAGEGGAKLLARRCSVPEEKIRTWVTHYRLHGVAGLQPKQYMPRLINTTAADSRNQLSA